MTVDKKRFKILIVDDNQASRKGLRALLKSIANTEKSAIKIEIVGEAEDGMEAVEMVQNLVPDLIFMDIKMPHMDGLEATSIIKKGQQETRIIILSMFGDQREAALGKGADGFIVKGSNAQAIRQAVLHFCGKDLEN